VPGLSPSSVHSDFPCAWAMRNVAPLAASLMVTGWPNEAGGSDLAIRSWLGVSIVAVIESSVTPLPCGAPLLTTRATAKN
jgi:hypothetical protein